jgi:replicative DNA helicase
MGDIGVEKIKEIVKQHISITGNKPVVIIDYLQILAAYVDAAHPNRVLTDKQSVDKNILELRRMSRDYKIPVVGISSFNRESYKAGGGANQGRVSMTDYKESGALEYSADVLMGLEFSSAGTKEYDEKAEKRKDPRQIRLVVLKNRNGKAWESCSFDYFPLFNYYSEA